MYIYKQLTRAQGCKQPRNQYKNRFIIQYGTKEPRNQGKGTKRARNQARKTRAQEYKHARNQGASIKEPKTPKNPNYFFERRTPPAQKKSVFVSGSVSQNRYNTQLLRISHKNYIFVNNF